jgi:hypothetical protein
MKHANLIIQCLVAFGTLAVAVSAIWGDWIRYRLAGPKLCIGLLDSSGTLTKRNDGKQGRYYKLRIWNDRKWSPAPNTRVVLKSIFKPAADGSLVPHPVSGPLQLTWQWLVPQFPTVGATEEACTFAHLIEGERFLVLSPYITPNNFVGCVGANERMVIEVAAVSDVADSAPLFLEISWNGQWSNDSAQMLYNVVIKELGTKPPG